MAARRSVGQIVVNLTAGTAEFIANLDQGNAALGQFSRKAQDAGNQASRSFRQVGDGARHAVTDMQATSAALRVLEGGFTNSLRAAERFVSNISGVGPLVQKLFPIAGGIALIGVFDELAQHAAKVYDAFKKFQEAPDKVADDFRRINGPLAVTNDQLALTNDRLANSIAKLEGKPENALRVAIDEAKLAADQLAESLNHDLDSLTKLLTENHVPWWQKALGRAGTDEIEKQIKDLAKREGSIGDTYSDALLNVPQGKDKAGLQAEKRQVDALTTAESVAQEQALVGQLTRVREQIKTAKTLQEKSQPTPPVIESQPVLRQGPPQAGPRNADGIPIATKAPGEVNYKALAGGAIAPQGNTPLGALAHLGPEVPNQEVNLPTLQQTARNITAQILELRQRRQEAALQGTESSLQANSQAESLTRPYENKLHELDAELAGIKNRLASIGLTATGEATAKAWGNAQQAFAKINDELAKLHAAPLSPGQQNELLGRFTSIEQAKAEEEFRTKLDQTTVSIRDRIQSLDLLTAAIGRGYEAQKQATVQEQVFQALGKDRGKINDPAFLAQRATPGGPTNAEVLERLRGEYAAENDAKARNTGGTDLDKLTKQIELENALAAAEKDGSEAVRLVTLQHELAAIAEDKQAASAQNLFAATASLAAAEQKRIAQRTNTNLDQQIAATERLTAAQLRGADAVRAAELANRIDEIRRNSPAEYQDQEVQRVTRLSQAQRQQQVVTEALGKGESYQNRLEEIDQEVVALHQMQAVQGDNLAIEISLRDLEKERAQLFTQQVSVLGTAREGFKAFFEEMATEGQSAAATIHDAFKKGFDSLNDALAKAVAGQKVNWANLFSSISENLTKMTLKNFEANFVSHYLNRGSQALQAGGQAQQGGFFSRLGHGLGGLLQPPTLQHSPVSQDQNAVAHGQQPQVPGLGHLGLGGRDGQTAASALFVTTVAASEAGNSAPSIAAVTEGPTPGGGSNLTISWPFGNKSTLGSADQERLLPFGGFRAEGGTVSTEKQYVVGERGPELFIPHTSGTIIPNHQLHASGNTGEWSPNTGFASELHFEASNALATLIPHFAQPTRTSPVGGKEYIVSGVIERFLSHDVGATTQNSQTIYLSKQDTPQIRAHERIHQVQQQLGVRPTYEQVVDAIRPAFRSREEAEVWTFKTGIHDGGSTASVVQDDAVSEAPATLFESAIMEGEGTAHISKSEVSAYRNYVALLQKLNPGKKINLDKVVPPALATAAEGGFRAEGGDVAQNTPYVVGEKGPELFVPNHAQPSNVGALHFGRQDGSVSNFLKNTFLKTADALNVENLLHGIDSAAEALRSGDWRGAIQSIDPSLSGVTSDTDAKLGKGDYSGALANVLALASTLVGGKFEGAEAGEAGAVGAGRQAVRGSELGRDGNAGLLPAPAASGRPAPNPEVRALANSYNRQFGRPAINHDFYPEVDQRFARRVANAYDGLQKFNQSPEVLAAYDALSREVKQQWDFAQEHGIQFEPWKSEGQPYANSNEMAADIFGQKHLWFYTGGEAHPLLGEIDPATGLSRNDQFRAVHDLFGHSAGGFGFGARGEEGAFHAHYQMFSDLAKQAMATETRGQNSWVNYGRQNYGPDGQPLNIPAAQRPFADQKVDLLPADLRAPKKSPLFGSELGAVRISRKPKAFQFFSPNEAESLSFAQAQFQLSSPSHQRVSDASREIDTTLGIGARQSNAIGDWSDGAENSIFEAIHKAPSYEAVRYSAALKGDLANQKAVIPFQVKPGGPDAVYRATIPNVTPEALRPALDEAGISFRTLIPRGKTGTELAIFDPGSTLSDKIEELAAQYNVQVRRYQGHGEFLGADTRESARDVYHSVISEYEAKSGDRLHERVTGHVLPDVATRPTDALTLGGAQPADSRKINPVPDNGAEVRYVRLGPPPTSGRSFNFRDGVEEPGTSVYRLIKNRGKWLFDDTQGATIATLSDARPLYEVKGDLLPETGADGEPLLTNISASKRLGRTLRDYDRVTEGIAHIDGDRGIVLRNKITGDYRVSHVSLSGRLTGKFYPKEEALRRTSEDYNLEHGETAWSQRIARLAGEAISTYEQSFSKSRPTAPKSAAINTNAVSPSEFGGFRAVGGPVDRNKVHVVGEKGPELFIPSTDGYIVPNHLTRMALDGGSTRAGAMQFAGCFADGGEVQAGNLHVVGEEGQELFLPVDTLQDLGEDELNKIGKIAGKKFLPQLAKGLTQAKDSAVAPGPSSAALDQSVDQNALGYAQDSQRRRNPHAFNLLRNSARILNISLATQQAGNQWLEFVQGAEAIAKVGGQYLAGGGVAAGGGAPLNLNPNSFAATSGSSAQDPGYTYSPEPSGSGLILRTPTNTATLTPDDQANLGDFSNSELGQLDTSGIGTHPLSIPTGGGGQQQPGTNWGAVGLQVGATALGLIARLLATPGDHHFRPGLPYTIPDFNSALAAGGPAKRGMTHLVGEKGPELFVQDSDGYVVPNYQLPAMIRTQDALPFGGYRAAGGPVDPSQNYVVGEDGPEVWTPPARGTIISNSELTGQRGGDTYIDARGTDPAATEQHVRRAQQATFKQSVKSSFKTYNEYKQRTPQTQVRNKF